MVDHAEFAYYAGGVFRTQQVGAFRSIHLRWHSHTVSCVCSSEIVRTSAERGCLAHPILLFNDSAPGSSRAWRYLSRVGYAFLLAADMNMDRLPLFAGKFGRRATAAISRAHGDHQPASAVAVA